MPFGYASSSACTASSDHPRRKSFHITDPAVRDRSSPGYAGAAISFFRSAGRSSNASVALPVVPPDDPDDDPLFVFANPLTASRRASGSTVSPAHADLIVT